MPPQVTALVSADDFVSVVRVHSDRLHDLLRRLGCGADEAVEVVEAYALALLDALVNRPETVVDMAGWLFGRALELGRRLEGGGDAPTEVARSVLAGTEGEAQVRSALARLPEVERYAVVLRDAYDLAPQSVAVALRRSPDATASLIATARMHFIGLYDDRQPPTLDDHTGRQAVDLTTLGRVADGSLSGTPATALRRHVHACTACEDVVEAQVKARRVAAGLPVIALPDDVRDPLLGRVAERAQSTLPTLEEVLFAAEEDEDVAPAISPLVVVVAIVLALVLGAAVALATREGGRKSAATFGVPTPTVAPSITAVFPTQSTSGSPTASPSATATATRSATASAKPTSSVTPSATATPSASATAAASAGISVSPTRGPNGTTVTVTGTGWHAGTTVTITYSDALGRDTGSTAQATTGPDGRFTAQLVARDSTGLPGRHTVTATNGEQSASATFTAQ